MGSRDLADFLRLRKRRGDTTISTPVTGIHSPATSGSANVPAYRIVANQSEIVTGKSVRGGTWQDACQLADWIAGRGTVEVPSYSPGVQVDEGEPHVFRWMTRPRFVTTRYAYSIRASRALPITLTVTIGADEHQLFAQNRTTAGNQVFYVDRETQSSDLTELSLTITGAETMPDGAALIEAISIEAVPRTVILCDGNELGMQPELLRSRLPIRQANIHDSLIDRIDDLRAVTRRPGMWQFARSDLDPWVISSGTPTALFSDPLALLGPAFFTGDTTSTTAFWALCKCSDGTTAGSITVDNISQGTGVDSIAIDAGTTGWTWCGPASILHDCEDNTTFDGRRLGRWDDATLKAARTAGSGTISIATISFIG